MTVFFVLFDIQLFWNDKNSMFLEYRSHSTTVRYVCTLGFLDYLSVKRIVVEIHGRAIKTSSVTSQSRRRRPT